MQNNGLFAIRVAVFDLSNTLVVRQCSDKYLSPLQYPVLSFLRLVLQPRILLQYLLHTSELL